VKYNSVQEFIDDCNAGLDIEFAYGKYQYTVLSWLDGGPLIGRQAPYDDVEQQFETPEQMLDKFMIDGKPLKDIITQVELLLH
jgi:hypothetical protein